MGTLENATRSRSPRAGRAMTLVRIEKPRASLADVREPEKVKHLMVEAPLGSWEGLERLQALISVEVMAPSSMPAEGVEPIGRLRTLRTLMLHVGREPTPGIAALAGLTELRSLSIRAAGPGGLADMGWMGDLVHLEDVLLEASGSELARVPLAPLRRASGLTDLRLYDVCPSEGVDVFGQGFDALEELWVTVPDAATEKQIRDLRADILVHAPIHTDGVLTAPEIMPVAGGFDVYLDLSEQLGVEGNHEAMEVVRERLARERPAWAAELSFDPEAGGVGVSAPRREPVEAFLAWAERLGD